MPDYALVLILMLPAGYLRLLGHELSHVVAVYVTGGTVVAFRPYPTTHEGRRYWGLILRHGGDDSLCAIAPLAKALTAMVLWVGPAVLWAPLWVFFAWEVTDVLWWLRGYLWRLPYSDGGKWRALS